MGAQIGGLHCLVDASDRGALRMANVVLCGIFSRYRGSTCLAHCRPKTRHANATDFTLTHVGNFTNANSPPDTLQPRQRNK
jgi:hypothetical protein